MTAVALRTRSRRADSVRPAANAAAAGDDVPPLAIVIIARNEARWIDGTVAAARHAARGFADCPIVLVDSCSTDETVALASRHPIRIVELNGREPCCAAMARVVGQSLTRSRHVLFVDGDTEIDAAWVAAAVALLDARPEIAGVGGKLRELYYERDALVGENPDCFGVGAEAVVADQLGGNALYRRAALEQAGGFNPYIYSYEEAELAERLRKHGYQVIRLAQLVGTHRTGRPGTVRELWRRYRSNLITGYGQVLRTSMRDGLFWAHARRMARYLAFDAVLAAGAASAAVAAVGGSRVPLVLWLGACATLLAAFVVRTRSLRKPLRQLLDWSFWAVPLVTGFLRRPRDPRTFSPAAVLKSDSGAIAASVVRSC
jgi:glycosyltransferase involved in cell wall biosynthesis